METLHKVPIISAERVGSIMAFFTHLAESLALRGLDHLRLLETTVELEKSEERFRSIANYTYDWESWIGVDGTLLWVNPAVERFIGYSVKECMAMQDYPLPVVEDADRAKITIHWAEAIAGSHGNDIEFRVRNKDGSLRWAAAAWQPIFDARGQSLGHRVSIRDITQRKQAEEELRKANEELETHVRQRTEELGRVNDALQAEITIREQALVELQFSNAQLIRSQERTALIRQATEVSSSSQNLDQVLEKIAETLAFAAGVAHCDIFLMDDAQDILTRKAGTNNLTPPQLAFVQNIRLDPVADDFIRKALEKKEPVMVPDAWVKKRVNWGIFLEKQIGTFLVAPLKVGEQVLGVAMIYTLGDHHSFTVEEVELVGGIANSVALAIENARLYEKTRQKLSESQGIQRVTTALLQKLDLKDALEIICAEAQRLTGATGSTVLLLEDSEWMKVGLSVGQAITFPDRILVQASLTGMAILNHGPFLTNDPASAKYKYHGSEQPTAFLAVPLRLNGNIIGALDLVNKPDGFSSEDIRILSLLADQAALIIEHARLIQQARQLAVLEERQRLARELHDSVTQALYSVTLYADAAHMALSAGKKEVTLENLHELRNMAHEAMLDMRLLIFELHPRVLEKEGLVAALHARLAAVEGRTGLQTDIYVEGERRLPLSMEEELYKIAQESLNNVVKHAKAQHLGVQLHFNDRSVCLELKDDGVGFDLEMARQNGGMGLRGIEERVERLGGKFEIESSPEKGTKLTIVIPSHPSE
jgi:PAS domain S-box-containing protein